MSTTAYVDNTNMLRLNGLKNQSSDEFLNNAAVTATIETVDGDEVAGETWPLTLVHVAGSDGNYERSIDHLVDFVPGGHYFAIITATHDGSVGKWKFRFKAAERISA